jgi:anti-anti-sigma factor
VEIDVRTQDQVKIVKLRGKLNLGASLDRTNETLKDLVNAGESRFLLDLEEVPMIDSSGIGLLVRYLTASDSVRCLAAGGERVDLEQVSALRGATRVVTGFG